MDVLSYPLDTIKTRLQSPQQINEVVNEMKPKAKLFRGVSTNIISFPAGFTYFLVYEQIKHIYEEHIHEKAHSSLCHFLAGSIAEIATISIRYFGSSK